MTNVPGESASQQTWEESQPSGNDSSNANENFECNICFELARDPIVTLCGHLFCWPCLYKWLRFHSNSSECPVCKAMIQEERLVPLYGRGMNNPSDPRSRSSAQGMEENIPNRPTGQRPQEPDHFHHHEPHRFYERPSGFPTISVPASRGHVSFSTAGLGLFLSNLANFHVDGFTGVPGGGGFLHGFPNALHGRHFHHGFPHFTGPRRRRTDSRFAVLFFIVGLLAVLALKELYTSFNQ